jgi:putative hydrolase of the HAD superfamily
LREKRKSVNNRRDDIQLILFDLGGVLVKPSGVATMLEWTGKSVAELWDLWLKSESVRAFESGLIDSEAFSNDVIKEFSIDVPPGFFMEAFSGWANTLYPGTKELLARLSKNYKIASLSNTNEVHWKILTEDLKLDDCFDYNFPSHITGLLKPDEDPFVNVSETLGVNYNNILFFDDNLPNINTAEKLGLKTYQTIGISGVVDALYQEEIYDLST